MSGRPVSFPLRLAPGIMLSPEDRTRHIVVASGIRGVGFSVYIHDLLEQELNNKIPVILIDQYGEIAKGIVNSPSRESSPNISCVTIGDERTVGLNIFDIKSDDEKREVCNAIIGLMVDLYDPNRTGIIGPRFEHAMRNDMLTIMYDDHPTFATLIRCLTDATYVQTILPKVTDETVRDYWTKQ